MASILRRLMHLATRRLHPNPRDDYDLSRVSQESSSRIQAAAVFESERTSQQKKQDDFDFSFEVDWSGISVGVAFQELLFQTMGLPSPFPEQQNIRINRCGFRQSDVDLHDLYLRPELRKGSQKACLVRGVIFDMAALATKLSPEEVKASLERRKKQDDRDSTRDWSNHLHGNFDTGKSKIEEVSAMEVMDKLGVKNVLPGLVDLVGNGAMARKKKLEAKQALEESMGRDDSIRAKYMDRIRQKKMMADTRREQGRFLADTPAMKLAEGMEAKCLAAPGSAAIVRYLQERGVVQCLLTRGPKEDFTSFMEQLGKFKFEDVKPFEGILSETVLKSVCEKWGLLSSQILVVVPDDHNPAAMQCAANKGFFVCRVKSQRSTSQEEETRPVTNSGSEDKRGQLSSSLSSRDKKGIKIWWNKLAEGTLQEQKKQETTKCIAHFRVLDMTELKWVIEDLNGVSYKATTFVRGFQ